MSRHDDLEIDISHLPPVSFELETARSHDVVGPYGAFVATMAPPSMAVDAWRPPPYAQSAWPPPRSRAESILDRVFDALATFPTGVWKRVFLYSFLFMVFGNLLRCRGLSLTSNVACIFLIVLGAMGLAACSQRSP